jgi:hypothetical protein
MDRGGTSDASSSTVSHEDIPLPIWNCTTCRRRKVRCDRRYPCSQCQKSGINCVFPNSGRLPTRRNSSNVSSSSKEKQTELLIRLRRLESIIESFETRRVEQLGDIVQLDNIDAVSNETPSKLAYPGAIVQQGNGSLYIGSQFWATVVDEVCS